MNTASPFAPARNAGSPGTGAPLHRTLQWLLRHSRVSVLRRRNPRTIRIHDDNVQERMAVGGVLGQAADRRWIAATSTGDAAFASSAADAMTSSTRC